AVPWIASGLGKLRPVNEASLSAPVGPPSSVVKGHSSRTTPVTPVAAATRIASSSYASGTGSFSERKASGPVSVAPSAKRRARRVKIASSAGKADAASSAPGRIEGRARFVVATMGSTLLASTTGLIAVKLDEGVRQRLAARFGREIESWFDELPPVLTALAQRWQVELDSLIPRGSMSVVIRCRLPD